MIVGLVSTFNEGRLGRMAVESLFSACDLVCIAEGPIGEAGLVYEPPDVPIFSGDYQIGYGVWESDAAKRNELLKSARDNGADWIVWLDGDEILVWGEYLPDYIARAEHGDEDLKVSGGFPLRLVELDGTVVQAMGRVIRANAVEQYLHSIVEVKLYGHASSVTLPNVPNWQPARAHRTPTGASVEIPADSITGMRRPPLQGEPHILHRSALRDPGRVAERQSEAEQRGYREQAEKLGVWVPE